MSTKRSKRYQEAAKLVTPNKNYSITEAVETMKSFPAPKFDPTVTVSFHLTVDPRKSDQMVRGSVSLPNGTGKNVRVLVFAQEAGAEFVGFEDLIKKVQEGFVDFDTAIATPDAMTEVRKVARVLGPRGLMPNPKTGTVTDDTAKAVKEVKAGRVDYKVDKNANISAAVGKLSFSNEGITENIVALIDSVVKARPASAKGAYIESVTVSCAMCPGLPVDTASIAKL
jgi:large subunit ribosomal protein L1